VPRLIKYSGFGNAAGLLANNGLLGALGGKPSASDSEDSETDDYEQVKDQYVFSSFLFDKVTKKECNNAIHIEEIGAGLLVGTNWAIDFKRSVLRPITKNKYCMIKNI
jgi:hypothetical protein